MNHNLRRKMKLGSNLRLKKQNGLNTLSITLCFR